MDDDSPKIQSQELLKWTHRTHQLSFDICLQTKIAIYSPRKLISLKMCHRVQRPLNDKSTLLCLIVGAPIKEEGGWQKGAKMFGNLKLSMRESGFKTCLLCSVVNETTTRACSIYSFSSLFRHKNPI